MYCEYWQGCSKLPGSLCRCRSIGIKFDEMIITLIVNEHARRWLFGISSAMARLCIEDMRLLIRSVAPYGCIDQQ
jgi:hypothetical protein